MEKELHESVILLRSIETQLTILKRIEDQANQTRFLSMCSLATLIAILVVLGAKL